MTTLYLNGRKAYRADAYGHSPRVNKDDCVKLISHFDEFDVIVSEKAAPKYAKLINRAGYLLTSREAYSALYGELKLHYKKIRFNF